MQHMGCSGLEMAGRTGGARLQQLGMPTTVIQIDVSLATSCTFLIYSIGCNEQPSPLFGIITG